MTTQPDALDQMLNQMHALAKLKTHATGAVIHGRCVTMQTTHTGNVVARAVAARWSDGTPRVIRYTIRELGTGRRIIIEPGTAEAGPA